MAMQTFGPLQYPGLVAMAGAPGPMNTNQMNVINELCGIVFIPRANITLHKIGFYISTNTSFVGTARAVVETVAATDGLPTGTEVGTGANFTPATATMFWVTMGADATLVAGTPYYVGIRITAYTSGSFLTYRGFNICQYEGLMGFPYTISTAASTMLGEWGCIGLENSAGAKVKTMGTWPANGITTLNYKSDSNPNTYGVRFKIPVPARVCGFMKYGDLDQDWTWTLYDSNGSTVLQSANIDKDIRATATLDWDFRGIPPTLLSKDTYYRFVITPGSTTAKEYWDIVTFANVADLDCAFGGQDFHITSCYGAPANEAAWTQTLTSYPIGFALFFDQFDDAVSDLPDAGNVRDTDSTGGTTGTLSSNKILKSNTTGSGAGNYNDDNLAVGNVRPVAYGLSATGTLANLVATDAAYGTLEGTRNSATAIAGDIRSGKNIKIANSTVNGNATFPAVANVRAVQYGAAGTEYTGTLANLAAGDTAYVTLENSRNNDNGTVEADISTGKSVKIRNTTINGSNVGGSTVIVIED